LQGIVNDIEAAGATLVALTPQLPEHSQTMVERHKLGFDLLSDPGNEYAAELGIRFDVPEDLKTVYQSLGIILDQHSGTDSWTLPMPGRIVTDSSGVVRTASFDPDYTHRPEPEVVLEELAKH
jgi:peroxiredoxin